MKVIEKTVNRMNQHPLIMIIVHGVIMGIMLALIFLRLYHTDFSTAPEFIYNQF